MSSSPNQPLSYSVQGRGFTARQLYKAVAYVCGGEASGEYLALLDLPISELIFHLEIFCEVGAEVRKKLDNKKSNSPAENMGGEIKWQT